MDVDLPWLRNTTPLPQPALLLLALPLLLYLYLSACLALILTPAVSLCSLTMASAEVRVKNYDGHVRLKKSQFVSLLYFIAKGAAKCRCNGAQSVYINRKSTESGRLRENVQHCTCRWPKATEVHCSLLQAVATAVICWFWGMRNLMLLQFNFILTSTSWPNPFWCDLELYGQHGLGLYTCPCYLRTKN